MIVAPKTEIKGMFQKNLLLLTPGLQESMLQIDETELWKKVEVVYNEEGYPVCRYHQDNHCFHITGEHPVQEAKQWYKSITEQGAAAVFLYGSGFGYPLFEIFDHKRPHTLVVLLEQDFYLFAAMLHYFDLEPIVKTQKAVFLVGGIEDFAMDFDSLIYSIVFTYCTYPAVAFTHASQRNFKAQYLKIHQYVFSQLGLLVFYVGNDHSDNLLGFENMIANAGEIVRNPYIGCLKDKYKDIPAFIIANGPSLDKNIRELKKIQNKGIIISTESAIVPLMENNIKPDILTIIERTKYTYTYHIEGIDYPEDMALLCLALVDRQVFPAFPGAKIPIFRKIEAINQWINRYIGDGSVIDAGANVSHLAFELAVYLGANPIVFVGQDYAYGPDGLSHSKDAVYNKEKGREILEIIRSFPVIYAESNEGPMIPTNQIWVDFKLGLERKIADHLQKTILNATEGGARIKGTKCERLSRVIEEYCTGPIPYHVDEIIAENKKKISIAERKSGLEELIKSAEIYADSFHTLALEAVKRKLECKEMMRLSQKEDGERYRSIMEKTYYNNFNVYQLYISDSLYRCFCQQVIFVHFYLMSRLGEIDTLDKTTEIFKIQHNFFHCLNIVFQSVSVHMENAVEFLKKIHEELENDIAGGGEK